MKILKKRLYALAWTIIVFLGLYLCVRGFSVVVFSGIENPLNSVINGFTSSVGKNVMNMYMPGVTYGIANREENSVPQRIINEVLENYPIYRYFDENSEYETTADSEYTYEMIIAAEAADENYVNHETGEAVNAAGELVAQENEEYANKENNNTSTDSTNGETTAGKKDASEANSDEEANNNVENTEQNTEQNKGGKNEETQETDQANTGTQANADAQVSSSSVVTPVGTEYSIEKLSDFDFLKNTFYSVDSTTSVNSDRLNAQKMLEKDMTLQQDSSVPQILIYHTHSQEMFADSVEGDVSTSIVGVGEYLAEILANKYGYNVIHNTSTYDLINGQLDRNYATTLAEPDIKRILQENPSIQVVIDLHRDGVNENTHFVTTINGKPTAKFMFFNGLSYNSKVGNIEYLYNPYIEDNLAFSFKMQLQAVKYYPDLTRKIYLKGYRYNLHLMPRATLVEVGGQTNTVEEAKNAMEPLADILDKVLKGN